MKNMPDQELRLFIREHLLQEIMPDIIDDPVSATRQAKYTATHGEVIALLVDVFIDIAEEWNQSPLSFIIKVPGLAGAEDYDWTEFALDAFLLVAGGAVARGALGLVARTGKRGKDFERGVRAVYAHLSRKVGPGKARQAVQLGLKSVGAQPTDTVIKKSVMLARDYGRSLKDLNPRDKIELELTPEEFRDAIKIVDDADEKLIKDQDFENYVELERNVYNNLGFEV